MIKLIIDKIYCLLMKSLYYTFRIFRIQKKKIVISSYFGKGFGGNSKYIVLDLLEKRNDLDIVFLVNNMQEDFPVGVRKVKYGSLKAIYELVTAKIWIDNARKARYVVKREKQKYIQTWHGSIALKRVEMDAADKLPLNYIKDGINDSKIANYFISNGKFCTNLYRNAFSYNGEILEVGSPRNDIFFGNNSSITEKIRNIYNIKQKNILLYAPTFRMDKNIDIYNVDFEYIIKSLEKKMGEEWVVLRRLHPGIADKVSSLKEIDKVIDVTDYNDMQELLVAADMLLTDYSSSMFDFMLMKKPVFLYTEDFEEYMRDRNFYFDLDTLPFERGDNLNMLVNKISEFSFENYDSRVNVFKEELGIMENGKAAQKVADLIIKAVEV
ncbi:MAG: CDP-glycerol glycerophosphotransferase family protein [Sarcina sp.]